MSRAPTVSDHGKSWFRLQPRRSCEPPALACLSSRCCSRASLDVDASKLRRVIAATDEIDFPADKRRAAKDRGHGIGDFTVQ